jgi:hypothetical protein
MPETTAYEYVNPIAGQELFDPSEFSRRGLDLYFAKTTVGDAIRQSARSRSHVSFLSAGKGLYF